MHSIDYINAGLSTAYGLRGALVSLDGEYDLNFRLSADDGQHYLVKVMRLGCDEGLIDLQCAALRHLEERAVELPLPKLVPTQKNQAYQEVWDEAGNKRILWVQGVLPGRNMNRVRPWTNQLLGKIGQSLGQFTRAMTGFEHDYSHRPGFKWNLANAAWIGEHLNVIEDAARRAVVARWCTYFRQHLENELSELRHSVIHGDVNDCNVLLAISPEGEQTLTGLIDFGDMCHGATVGDLAIACAYGMMRKTDPIGAMAQLVSHFHAEFALTDQEIRLVFPLAMTRLAVSVVNSALASLEDPHDAYATLSESEAFSLLMKLDSLPPRIAELRLRIACGLPPQVNWPALRQWLADQIPFASVFPERPGGSRLVLIDMSFESTLGGSDLTQLDLESCAQAIAGMTDGFAHLGIGRYGEARPVYAGPSFSAGPYSTGRTHHLGIDLFAQAGTAVAAPLAGTVEIVDNLRDRLDYGGLVVLRHRAATGDDFFTLYGHLDPASVQSLSKGQMLQAGEVFARLGDAAVNGGWPAHLHFQLLLEVLPGFASPPGVATHFEFDAYKALSPNPAVLLNLEEEQVQWEAVSEHKLSSQRQARFADNLKLSYAQPFAPVRAWRHHLYDAHGRCYLDAYNNVPHVGHSHPAVIEAVAEQWRRLNTNSRYLFRQLGDYADRLVEQLPEPLEVCFFVNSGSEANELALRLARTHTDARDLLVMDYGYHGWTTGTFAISPYKTVKSDQRPPWVHVTPQPDCYRGAYGYDDSNAGKKYAAKVGEYVHKLNQENVRVAGYICEALPSVGGQVVPPADFLRDVYAAVRAAGGVCILDDVQTGFGRVGSHMWGFDLHAVTPDVVVLGKPMGNGFPLGAVITTRQIAASFNNGIEYFSTFGGNTAACAAGMAVLDILQGERLQANAHRIGKRLKAGLYQLQSRFPLVGDVRGHGLFLGAELVEDQQTLEPAGAQAEYVKNRLRSKRVLVGLEGPHDNVLKIRPPMTFDEAAADHLLAALGEVLAEEPAQPVRRVTPG